MIGWKGRESPKLRNEAKLATSSSEDGLPTNQRLILLWISSENTTSRSRIISSQNRTSLHLRLVATQLLETISLFESRWSQKYTLVRPKEVGQVSTSMLAFLVSISSGWRRQKRVRGSWMGGKSMSQSDLQPFLKWHSIVCSALAKGIFSALALSSSKTGCRAMFWWVTSSGIMTRGMSPLRLSTSAMAWGSKQMLNYAAGVMLPFSTAPPIITIRLIFFLISGQVSSRMQRLVSEPVLHQVTCPSTAFSLSQIWVKFFSVWAFRGETGNSTPPSPLEPCMCSARFILPLRIWFEPRITSTSSLPMLQSTLRAFWVVLSSEVLPGEVDTPIKLIPLSMPAQMMAKVSSRPGSQSSHTGYGFFPCMIIIFSNE